MKEKRPWYWWHQSGAALVLVTWYSGVGVLFSCGKLRCNFEFRGRKVVLLLLVVQHSLVENSLLMEFGEGKEALVLVLLLHVLVEEKGSYCDWCWCVGNVAFWWKKKVPGARGGVGVLVVWHSPLRWKSQSSSEKPGDARTPP